MQKPGHKVDLAKTEAEVRLTTGLDESTQTDARVKTEGQATTQQEFRVSTQTDMEVELDEGFHSDRLLESSTDTHTGNSTSTHTDAQSDTRHKTQSGELSSLERHADPDGTIGCNTCQEDLADAISEHCKINVGDIIASRYEIKTYLGEGGMSAVYAAVDKVIKRDVALKILHRDLLVRGKGSLLRFQREAQALGNLDHPNIVKIHHFDADENAQPYIVMDIVQGEPLARRLVKDPDSVRFTDIIDIFVQVCDALSHAHSRGVVHRDLKPSNIMVIGNQVKVLDFGIAKLMSEDSDQELQLTRTGEVFGSPLYMSPEQCRGLKLDYRSDIYSLGCVMYEAFTGNPPFTGNSHIDTMLKHVNDLPASVVSSMCDARYVEKVDAILLRCMAKNPNARFQSMDEVKAALLELERDTKGGFERVKQKFELIGLKLSAQGKLTKKMIAAYSAAALLVVGLGSVAVIQHNSSEQHYSFKNVSIEQWKELNEQGQADFNAGRFAKAQSLFSAESEMANRLGNKQLKLSSFNELLDLYNAQLILNPKLIEDNLFRSRTVKVAQEIDNLHKSENSEIASLRNDLTNSGSQSIADQRGLAQRAIDFGSLLSEHGRHKESIELLKAAVSVAEKTNDKVLMANAYFNLGRAYTSNHNPEQALAEFSKSLKLREEVLSKNDVDIARALAGVASASGLEVARPMLERVRAICSVEFSQTSHQVGWADMLLAWNLYDSKQYAAAKQKADSSIATCKAAIDDQLSMEEQFRAKQTLVRAYNFRALANTALLQADLKKGGKVADPEARAAAIRADFAEALKYVQELNPKPNAREVDALTAYLLYEDALALKQAYEVAMATSGSAPNDESGHPALLNQAKFKLARALAINKRLPSGDSISNAAKYYLGLANIDRSLLDFPAAERSLRLAKQNSDLAYGANSAFSNTIQHELDALLRDSGKK
ncbi:MAG: hypothetical protein C0469_00545 [Cyanobacteria bacterium DS2.3.42]|nr:hypothetical protein [Cyanobacteria bacterium DS2.3.42]